MANGLNYGYGMLPPPIPAPNTVKPVTSPFAGLFNGLLGRGAKVNTVAPVPQVTNYGLPVPQANNYGSPISPVPVPVTAPIVPQIGGMFDRVFKSGIGENWWVFVVLFFLIFPSSGKGILGHK